MSARTALEFLRRTNPAYAETITPAIMGKAVAFNYLGWPRQIISHVQDRDVLDVGCGTGHQALGYVVAGVKSYTGLDPVMDVHSDRAINRRASRWESFGWTPVDIMRRIPIVRLIPGSFEDIAPEEQFDIAVLHNVTEHLHNLDTVFEGIVRRLRPRGRLLYQHHNFFCWNGHHKKPKTVAAIDPGDPEQKRYIDWEHLKLADSRSDILSKKLNKIRLQDLRRLTKKYFTILDWQEIRTDPGRGSLRLTGEILRKYPQYKKKEFLIQNVICLAKVK